MAREAWATVVYLCDTQEVDRVCIFKNHSLASEFANDDAEELLAEISEREGGHIYLDICDLGDRVELWEKDCGTILCYWFIEKVNIPF